MIDLLHFLRPLWLLFIPVIAVIWWQLRRREGVGAAKSRLIAPHLSDALVMNRHAGRGIRPEDGIALAMLFAAVAAAGPTWSKQTSPWFAESAPLVIAIEVTDSMRSNDLLPTRLDRARFKVLDLVAQRTGARTALIAYAGSAHIVVPPSADAEVLKPFLESLDPAIMPAGGARAAAVLPLARRLLGREAVVGTLLFVNDGFAASEIAELAAFAAGDGAPSMAALVMGTDRGGVALLPDGSAAVSATGARIDTSIDPAVLRRVARGADISIVRSGTGDSDIRQLLRTVESNLRSADDPDARWHDEGWWLLWPALLLSLASFRRGWIMRW